jgi:RNA polymerase sigma-70 factor (ECF subfamily)
VLRDSESGILAWNRPPLLAMAVLAETTKSEVSPPSGLAERKALSFAEFYEEHFSFVWRNVRRLTHTESVVDDLVQEVFLIVLRRLPDFEQRTAAPTTWLFAILINVVRGYHRTTRRRIKPQPADFETVMAPDTGPDASAERAQALRMMNELLAALDDDKREVYVLAELEQMTAPEIVEITGANLTTVYARLRDARREIESAARRYHTNRPGRRT